jgi:hypothetical protein
MIERVLSGPAGRGGPFSGCDQGTGDRVDEDRRAHDDEPATRDPDRTDEMDAERLCTTYDDALQLISECLPSAHLPEHENVACDRDSIGRADAWPFLWRSGPQTATNGGGCTHATWERG